MQRWHEGIILCLVSADMSVRLLNLHSVCSNDWSETPQDTRVSVRWNQGSGHVSQVLMWHCSSQCTYTYSHCNLTCMTSPSPAQKTHLHPRVQWSVHLHLWNVSSLLFVICCLRFSFFRVTCCSCIMNYFQNNSLHYNVQCITYCTQTHYYPFTLTVFAIWYFFYCTYDSIFFVFFLFIILCFLLSTAYDLNLTFHNMQMSVLTMFRLMFYDWNSDGLHTKDFLFFIILWILLTAYFSQSDYSVFLIDLPVIRFWYQRQYTWQQYSRKSVVRHNNYRQMSIVNIIS